MNFEPRILQNISEHLTGPELVSICRKLPVETYQKICRDEQFWRKILYRDYSVFLPIIKQLERESYMSYLDLYKEFYADPFFNSPDFIELYQVLSRYLPVVNFVNEDGNLTILPSLVKSNVYIEDTDVLRFEFPLTLDKNLLINYYYVRLYMTLTGTQKFVEIKANIDPFNGLISLAKRS